METTNHTMSPQTHDDHHDHDASDTEQFRACVLHQTLANRVRNDLILTLDARYHDEGDDAFPITAFDLAGEITVAGDRDISLRERESIIHNNHLPWLDDYDFIDYDADRAVVETIDATKVPMAADLERKLLAYLADEWGEPDQ